jgi:hypothetical protein
MVKKELTNLYPDFSVRIPALDFITSFEDLHERVARLVSWIYYQPKPGRLTVSRKKLSCEGTVLTVVVEEDFYRNYFSISIEERPAVKVQGTIQADVFDILLGLLQECAAIPKYRPVPDLSCAALGEHWPWTRIADSAVR